MSEEKYDWNDAFTDDEIPKEKTSGKVYFLSKEYDTSLAGDLIYTALHLTEDLIDKINFSKDELYPKEKEKTNDQAHQLHNRIKDITWESESIDHYFPLKLKYNKHFKTEIHHLGTVIQSNYNSINSIDLKRLIQASPQYAMIWLQNNEQFIKNTDVQDYGFAHIYYQLKLILGTSWKDETISGIDYVRLAELSPKLLYSLKVEGTLTNMKNKFGRWNIDRIVSNTIDKKILPLAKKLIKYMEERIMFQIEKDNPEIDRLHHSAIILKQKHFEKGLSPDHFECIELLKIAHKLGMINHKIGDLYHKNNGEKTTKNYKSLVKVINEKVEKIKLEYIKNIAKKGETSKKFDIISNEFMNLDDFEDHDNFDSYDTLEKQIALEWNEQEGWGNIEQDMGQKLFALLSINSNEHSNAFYGLSGSVRERFMIKTESEKEFILKHKEKGVGEMKLNKMIAVSPLEAFDWLQRNENSISSLHVNQDELSYLYYMLCNINIQLDTYGEHDMHISHKKTIEKGREKKAYRIGYGLRLAFTSVFIENAHETITHSKIKRLAKLNIDPIIQKTIKEIKDKVNNGLESYDNYIIEVEKKLEEEGLTKIEMNNLLEQMKGLDQKLVLDHTSQSIEDMFKPKNASYLIEVFKKHLERMRKRNISQIYQKGRDLYYSLED